MQYTIPTTLPSEIFRSYDIRGIVNQSLSESIVYAIGLALGKVANDKGQQTFVLGYDHRESSPGFLRALCLGLRESGINIINIGLVPTPMLYFACHYLKTYSGVMITGSHCAPEYNGLKMMLAGDMLADEAIQSLADTIKAGRFISAPEGTYEERDISDAYIQAILERVSPIKKKLKIVIDAGHGMMSRVAPRLFEALDCEVIPLYCSIDSSFPHHHPDPSQPENLSDLIQVVQKEKADLGVAFDGDGDRIGVVTSAGKIIWPDRLMAVFSEAMLIDSPGGTVIFDVKCSRHLGEYIAKHDGEPLLWKTGHSHIKSKMKATSAILAGEMSGHIFFGRGWFGFDDALYAAAYLVSILAKQSLSSEAFFEKIPDSLNTPELKLAMSEEQKFPFMAEFIKSAVFPMGKVTTIDGIRVDYPDGFGLLRASNTSPYLILRFEGDTLAALERIQHVFRDNLLKLDINLKLPF